MSVRVERLFVHPIKSARAIEVSSLALDELGAVGDRRWLVVDETGEGITARTTPALALVQPSFDGEPEAIALVSPPLASNRDAALTLRAPGHSALRVTIPSGAITRPVTIWNDTVSALDAGDEAAAWMSEVLSRTCRLVRLDDAARRPLRAKYAGYLPRDSRRVAFTDGAPLLVLGQASIDYLNERMVLAGGEAFDVRRFRPNVLLRGGEAHDEDTWRSARIGEVSVAIGEPCSRCVMTTIDPSTGAGGVEPLRTLAQYRRQQGEVMFGMNATHEAPGIIRVGDTVIPALS